MAPVAPITTQFKHLSAMRHLGILLVTVRITAAFGSEPNWADRDVTSFRDLPVAHVHHTPAIGAYTDRRVIHFRALTVEVHTRSKTRW